MKIVMIDQWISEIKKNCPPESLGMILVHNGVVRATSKEGKSVSGIKLSYDRAALDELVRRMRVTDGIADIRVRINEGNLKVGDDIMHVCVAGRYRTDIFPIFKELISLIKNQIVREEEI